MSLVGHVVLAHSNDADADTFVSALTEEGFDTVSVRGALQAIEHVQTQGRGSRVRLVLLQDPLEHVPGVDLIRCIRAMSAVPIVVLAEHDHEDTIVEALDAGADDYLVQPISQRELVARIRTILRRFTAPKIQDGSVVRAGPITLDLDRHTARIGDRPLHLPLREYQVLQVLAQNHDYIVTRTQLFEAVGGTDDNDPRTITTYIRRLRAKIEADPHEPRHIVTIRGLGYKLET